MKTGIQRLYNRKRPAHPDSSHTKSKSWFKQKGRKSARKLLKEEVLVKASINPS